MSEEKWRFPASGFGDIKGENTGDKELFKKDSYVSLGREILQNSIDQRYSDEEPVRVEFNEFEMKPSDIPGVEEYKNQIKRCISFWKSNDEYVNNYKSILAYLENDKIPCLKISDYNTTGLLGIESEDVTADSPYIALVKGTGVSKKKNDYAGGSKGVGKNVPFILSDLVMVFYVSKTVEGYHGSIGVTKLVAGYVDDNESNPRRDYTQGTGYFGKGIENAPLNTYLRFDKNFKRDLECGTDIYIIGFKKLENWLKDVISSTLDSFLVSIYGNELEVSFNGIDINKSTLEDIINSDYINNKNKKSIHAQYDILNNVDKRVHMYDIETELGNAQMYILTYPKSEENNATKKCAMIRTPKMFIRNYDLQFNVSAMVIIDKNNLGKKLREIENPQHVDWEPKRIRDISERKEVENAINAIKEQIAQNVIDCLKLGDDSPIDPNGAGEYLSDEEFGEDLGNNQSAQTDKTDESTIGKIRRIKYVPSNTNIPSEELEGTQPEIGDIEEADDGEESLPDGHNEGRGGEAHSGDNSGTKTDGENEIKARAYLKNVKFKVISTNKNEGRLKVVFVPSVSAQKAYISISMLDDNNNSVKTDIKDLIVNGTKINDFNPLDAGPFEIVMNQKTVCEIQTDIKDYFASEVKITYESR